ncbi:sodium/calcium exchanger regulatory protein 1-like isoform X1 [Mytilus trossulus]|uniref:sodium/calcium exchanger regulatory protein 1-like isoform X1 n=1 Tax=Mytilus trossulus TaxID=6551 RepID=UPI003007118C
MAQFTGTWQIDNSTGFDDYMKAIGVPDDRRQQAMQTLGDSSKMTYKISNDGNDWTFGVTTSAGSRDIKFTLGTEIDTTTLDGRPLKALYTLEGNNLTEKQTGPDFESVNVRTVDGDTMTMVMTGNGVSCTRKYKKI